MAKSKAHFRTICTIVDRPWHTAGPGLGGRVKREPDIRIGSLTVVTSDDLCSTAAELAALRALRQLAGADSAMERHCHRQFLIAERLAGGAPVRS